MPIINRNLSPGLQAVYVAECVGPVGSSSLIGQGMTFGVAVVPFPAQLVGAGVGSLGLSGAPNLSLWINRFISGSGFTTICVGASMAAWAFGTSGGQTFNVGAGVTYPLKAGDNIILSCAGANTAADKITITLALQALEDIRSCFGASL